MPTFTIDLLTGNQYLLNLTQGSGSCETKLDISIFNGYTGNTRITLNDIELMKADKLAVVYQITSTTYNVVDADNNKILEFTNTGATTIYFPTGLTTGFQVVLVNIGGGTKTISGIFGSVVQSRSSYLKISNQYSAATVYCRDNNLLLAFGDLTP